jgi:hypothetical protein
MKPEYKGKQNRLELVPVKTFYYASGNSILQKILKNPELEGATYNKPVDEGAPYEVDLDATAFSGGSVCNGYIITADLNTEVDLTRIYS